MKLITWNIAGREEVWNSLLNIDADVALLQEAIEPPIEVASAIEINPALWVTAGAGKNRPWRAAIANLSHKYKMQWLESKSIAEANPGELAVSRLGTLSAAMLFLHSGEEVIVISIYASWENAHNLTCSRLIYADASVHRLISDLSVFIGQQTKHRIIVAGDFNILYGYGEHGSPYWASRYETVFTRMAALGLKFMGPQSPDGRIANPWPEELPPTSKNVPTFHHNRQTPETATRQLDFVFVSNSLCDRVRVKALNNIDDWGSSDHCRVEIELLE